MPTPHEILAGLIAISNQALYIAIAWHLVLAVVIVALAVGWRPSQRTGRALLVLPLGSVAALAFAFGNPFNGLVFSVAASSLAVLALVQRTEAVSRGGSLMSAAGIAMIAFGWIYPHFLEATATAYLYAAPVGLVPCPTLAIAVGFTLLGDGLGARAWSVTLALFGLFYGLFGVLRLGVHLDLGLVAGAAILAIATLRSHARP